MSAQPGVKTDYITPEEYIEMETASDVKHDYFNGQVLEREVLSATHNCVVTGVIGSTGLQLRRTPCDVFGSDQRVKVEATGLRAYPDVTITCEPCFENDKQLDLLNPRVIFEVLSPGTVAYDRGEKFRHYRQISSLREYILVEIERPHIEHFIRQENGGWLLLEYDGLETEFRLESVDCILCAAEIYERVTFEENTSEQTSAVEDSADENLST